MLCQTREDYFLAWEEGRGPGQKRPLTEKQKARKASVAAAVARTELFVSSLRLLRLDSERGIADTAQRLLVQESTSPDARELLERLLKQCSCSRQDAVERLNEQYPYALLSSSPLAKLP